MSSSTQQANALLQGKPPGFSSKRPPSSDTDTDEEEGTSKVHVVPKNELMQKDEPTPIHFGLHESFDDLLHDRAYLRLHKPAELRAVCELRGWHGEKVKALLHERQRALNQLAQRRSRLNRQARLRQDNGAAATSKQPGSGVDADVETDMDDRQSVFSSTADDTFTSPDAAKMKRHRRKKRMLSASERNRTSSLSKPSSLTLNSSSVPLMSPSYQFPFPILTPFGYSMFPQGTQLPFMYPPFMPQLPPNYHATNLPVSAAEKSSFSSLPTPQHQSQPKLAPIVNPYFTAASLAASALKQSSTSTPTSKPNKKQTGTKTQLDTRPQEAATALLNLHHSE